MDIEVTSWQIPGSDGQPIYGNMHMPEGQAKGVLICCHGFKGYKDYGFLPVLCDQAAQRGLVAMRFNFSHSGMTNSIDTFECPELFEKDRWSRQVEDIAGVVRYWSEDDKTEGLPLVLYGHSRGGVSACLACSRTDAPDFYNRFWHATGTTYKSAGLITAAAPDYACKLDDLVKDQLRVEGRLLSPSGRTGQDLYVGLDWLEEIERDPELYDPVLAAAHVKCPMLVMHGDADDTVPADCAHNLHKAGTPHSRLEIIEGANHVFNCPNPVPDDMPYEDLPEQTRRMIELSVDFAVRCCQAAKA